VYVVLCVGRGLETGRSPVQGVLPKQKKKTPWPLVRKRTIPTEQPPLVGEVSAKFADRGCRVVSATDPHGR
jgi:hypothetical protein